MLTLPQTSVYIKCQKTNNNEAEVAHRRMAVAVFSGASLGLHREEHNGLKSWTVELSHVPRESLQTPVPTSHTESPGVVVSLRVSREFRVCAADPDVSSRLVARVRDGT